MSVYAASPMCGRFTYLYTWKQLHRLLDLGLWPAGVELSARFNVAPTQGAPVVRVGAGGVREGAVLRWGLVPFWAKDESIGNRLINARGETLAEKPAFRNALAKRRCVVPVSGFYEWQSGRGGKRPHYFCRADEQPMLFAGLWERWDKGEQPLETFTIVTVEANELLAVMHDRMPAILEPESVGAWLDTENVPAREAVGLLRPCDPALLMTWPVGRRVNSPRVDDPSLIARAEDDGGGDIEKDEPQPGLWPGSP